MCRTCPVPIAPTPSPRVLALSARPAKFSPLVVTGPESLGGSGLQEVLGEFYAMRLLLQILSATECRLPRRHRRQIVVLVDGGGADALRESEAAELLLFFH